MDPIEKDRLASQSHAIRAELKSWEKAFSSTHNGKKASREDIKNNPEIAAKYKDYNKLRDILAGKIPYPPPPPSTTSQTPRKRKREHGNNDGVSKRQILAKTPSKTPPKSTLNPWEVDPYDSPSVIRNLFTPSRKALGPTPQKDGVVLGIFDLLEETSNPLSKSPVPRTQRNAHIASTPRKTKEDMFESRKHSKSPASASKRFLLDAFATPLKKKESNPHGGITPSSVPKLHFSTPSFLRRDSQRINLGPPTVDGELGTDISPQAIRMPRKPLVRGLSSILAGLRKIEEEAHDEDLEALHELEAEEAGKAPSKLIQPQAKETVLVNDSQQDFLLGGFDDEARYDTETEEAAAGLGVDGKPLRVYKKKGQKRTTRKVKMRPSRAKPQALPTTNESGESDTGDDLPSPSSTTANLEGEAEEAQGQAIPETQFDPSNPDFNDARNFDSDTQSEYTASEGGTRRKRVGRSRKEKKAEEGRLKKGVRKVTSLAGQNFKRLKLRNSGAKGGPGVGSRFRRRR